MKKFLPSRSSLAWRLALPLAVLTGRVAADASVNPRSGSYEQTFNDGLDCSWVQAVTFTTGAARIAPQWTWVLQGFLPAVSPYPGETDQLFNDPGSATLFATYERDAGGVLGVQLWQRWWSAATDMLDGFGHPTWQNDCPPPLRPGDPGCLLYRVSDPSPGVRSPFVLDVPDVARFNDAQCPRVPPTPRCVGSMDFTIVDLGLSGPELPDLLRGGRPIVATWMLRSPGENPSHPLDGAAFNNRLAAFRIGYTWSVNGGCASHVTDPPSPPLLHQTYYYGGATDPSLDHLNTTLFGCDYSHGCPIRLLDGDASGPYYPGAATLYLNGRGSSPYTPYTFSFCVSQDPSQCTDCSSLSGSLREVCCTPPVGTWDFALVTSGLGTYNDDRSSERYEKCQPTVNGAFCRASASLFIDGLLLTAGSGSYRTPWFDSLSPNTQWLWIDYDVEVNAAATGRMRTPVGIRYAMGNAPHGWSDGGTGITEAFMSLTTTGARFSSTRFTPSEFLQLDTTLFAWDYAHLAVNPPPWGPVPFPTGNPWPTSSADPRYGALDTGALAFPPSVPPGISACENFGWSVQHDGRLTPRVRRLRAAYVPDAGQVTSALVTPAALNGWTSLTFSAMDVNTGGSGSVFVDILDQSGRVLVGNLTTTTVQPVGLSGFDPNRVSGLKVRFRLYRSCATTATGDPAVNSFKLNWTVMKTCLALSRNALNSRRGESVVVRFCTGVTGTVDVLVHDSAGQLVARLFHESLAVGQLEQRTWDGLNGRHQPVAAGVYFVTAVTPGGREQLRLAVVR